MVEANEVKQRIGLILGGSSFGKSIIASCCSDEPFEHTDNIQLVVDPQL